MTIDALILCIHNSAGRVLAEGMLNRCVMAHNVGSAPSGRINPFSLEESKNAESDTSAYRSKSWEGFSTDSAPPLSNVITACASVATRTCPVYFGDAPVRRQRGEAPCLRSDPPGHRLSDAANADASLGHDGLHRTAPHRAASRPGRDRPQLIALTQEQV